MRKSQSRFRREEPQDRIRQLGEAALRCIEKKGVAGISARQFSAEAGVTQGLITHYFGEVQELVAYAFDIMSDGILNDVIAATEAAGPDPSARLNAYIEASFSPAIFDPNHLAIWVTFWGLILHSPRMRLSQKKEYTIYLDTVQKLLSDLARQEGFVIHDTRQAAISFIATLDGLWLAWGLNPAAFDPEDGRAMCHRWIEGLRLGAYARPLPQTADRPMQSA